MFIIKGILFRHIFIQINTSLSSTSPNLGFFNIVIGNPPYVFTRDTDFSNEFKNYIFNNYFSLISNNKRTKGNQSGKINLFAIFILKGIILCKINGYLSFIIPNNILRTTIYDSIRMFILNNTSINELVDLGSGIFKNVTASTIIMQLSNISNNDNLCKIITNIIDLKCNKYDITLIEQKQFKNNVSHNFNIFANSIVINLINKIKNQKYFLGDFCIDIIEGIVAHKQLISIKKFKNSQELVEGKTIRKYGIKNISKYILWDKSKIHRTRPDYLWSAKKKIIIQRISGGANPLTAALDTKKYKTFASVNNLILREEYSDMYEVILALINSKILNWYYANNFSNNSKLTVNISKTYLEKLPIPHISSEQKKLIKNIVCKIINVMEDNENNDISDLENEINLIIYKIFGLTFDEVSIIENKKK